ncbi:DNA polymerase III subunit delta' [Galenea microaerophila]
MILYPWQQTQWQQWQQQVAQQRIAHAYLLSGMAGLGLTDFALQMAVDLLCTASSAEPCQQCASCHLLQTQQHPDLFQINVAEDKKEITIAQVRALTEKLYETAHQGGYKVAIIEAAETLNVSAFNALLKTLEEPPAQTVLILTTHAVSQLPATILSRCQKLNFTSPAFEEGLQWCQQACPQADEPLIKRALRLHYGAPLAAKSWIESGEFQQYQQWQQDCQALQKQQKWVPEVVAEWLKWEKPEVILDYFYHWSVSALRQALYQQKRPYHEDLLLFQKVVLSAKQLWLGNVNQALLLENVLLIWLARQTENFKSLAEPLSRSLNRE